MYIQYIPLYIIYVYISSLAKRTFFFSLKCLCHVFFPLHQPKISRKMCDLNRESGSRSLQMLMTGSAIVRGVHGKETHTSHIHHYHDHQGTEAAAATCSTWLSYGIW